ncbi:MAG: hypothetical protein H7X89_12205 [Rhizobiales bacterium]|nr:hypothetical protein [Hyphomicrobiales bacterium]
MLKSTLVAAAFSVALIVPAYAENAKCDEATMTMMTTEIEALTDAGKKEMAMAEMQKAKDMMTANDMDGCGTQLDAAAKVYK